MRKIALIVIHCTASRTTTNLTPAALDTLHRSRGWACCGYHYYITKDGTIHPMRPTNIPGAHARGHNRESIGIAYEGGLTAHGQPADTRTPEQRSSLRTLLRQLRHDHPAARILGHRDLSPDRNQDGHIDPHEWIKQCPCFNAAQEYADI